MIQSQGKESGPDSAVNTQDFTGSGEREGADRELMDLQIKGLVILGKKKKKR